jgi:betaine-aldehyde dehydrogenase
MGRIDTNHMRAIEVLPKQRGLYYGGEWHEPRGGYGETYNPANAESLGAMAEANSADVDAAVQSAQAAFLKWRETKPLDRGELLRKIASILHENAEELALIDALNCGNPFSAMIRDVHDGAKQIEFFAGLVTEAKGEVTPMGPGVINMSVREPYGVCARIVAYNHPLMFVATKLAAPLAVGNTVILKSPPQAPLSAYRMMELLDGILPPGVLNLISGGRESGQALSEHPLVPVVTLVGSVESGRACARSAADRLKKIVLELGGKNALIAYPDADIQRLIDGAVRGMNFGWCGQSCGSTSRLFLHESIYDVVVEGILKAVQQFKPGDPLTASTTMGAIISKAQVDKIMRYIEIGKSEGARLLTGGGRPTADSLMNGNFIEPTIFGEVTPQMRIAREEIFGPVLSIIRWNDEEKMFVDVNSVDYGLTASIFTTSLSNAHRAARRVEAGFVWVNNAGPHFLGVPFGGYKLSGLGREESIAELDAFTQVKNINITL